MSLFTLSRFRKDIMVLAVGLFPEEFALDKESLGTMYKFFVSGSGTLLLEPRFQIRIQW